MGWGQDGMGQDGMGQDGIGSKMGLSYYYIIHIRVCDAYYRARYNLFYFFMFLLLLMMTNLLFGWLR